MKVSGPLFADSESLFCRSDGVAWRVAPCRSCQPLSWTCVYAEGEWNCRDPLEIQKTVSQTLGYAGEKGERAQKQRRLDVYRCAFQIYLTLWEKSNG